MHRRTIIATFILAALAVSLWPAAAHANLFTDAAGGYVSFLLGLVVDFLQIIRSLLIELISILGKLMSIVIGQAELNYGGVAVYTIWKLLRDICNLFFIVVLIGISFGTIFNTLDWFKGWHYSTALTSLIIAAIFINFSLAISQTIVWGGNLATGTVVNLISDKNIGAKIAVSSGVTQVFLGQQGTPVSVMASASFTGNAKTAFDNCQKYNQQPTVEGCVALGVRISALDNAAATDLEISRLNQSPSLKNRLNDAWLFWANSAKGAVQGVKSAGIASSFNPYATALNAAKGGWNGASLTPIVAGTPNAGEQARRILSLILNVFLLLVLVLSYGTVILFMVLRFPMIWILLAASSIAFFCYAIPGSGLFRTWIRHLIGWCLFTPLYLFVIYLGLFLLSQQNTLLAGMQNAAFFSGSFGILIFYVMTAIIFIFGARLALKTAFAFSSHAETLFGKIGGLVGVTEKGNFGINALSRRVGATGAFENLKATGEAGLGRVKQVRGNIANRIPGADLFRAKSYEQRLAEKKAAMGVYGGDKERSDVIAKNVEVEEKRLQLRLAQVSKDKQEDFLRGQMKSSNSNVALAARESLLKRGELSEKEEQDTRAMYPAGAAQRAFDDRKKRAVGQAATLRKKDMEEKRNDIIATVGAMKAINAPAVDKMLKPYFEPDPGSKVDTNEQRAYVEALGLKDPSLLFDYLHNPPQGSQRKAGSEGSDLARAFAPILKKPENALDLPDEFFTFKDPATQVNTKLENLKKAINKTYSPTKINQLRITLIKERGDKFDRINEIFS